MRETLPQVLDHHPAGALVVSLYDDTVSYVNPAAKKIFPSLAEDEKMAEAVHDLALSTGIHIGWGPGVAQTLSSHADEWVIHHSALGGGMWAIATRMPDIDSYPPSAILTLQPGAALDDARIGATQVHINVALAARLAVLLDESARDMRMAYNLVSQASERIATLQRDLVTSMSEYANPAPLAIIQIQRGA